MDIGSKITELRKQHNLSQTELAKKIDASRTIVGNYERNENTPSIDVATKIADALGVTLDYLVKDGEYEQVDNETLKRLRDIQKLKESDKQHVFALLDAFIKQTKLQGIL